MPDDPHEGSKQEAAAMRRRHERAEPVADDMERRSEELAREIEDVKDDWERKKADPRVPGAPEPFEDVETERQDLGERPGGGDR